MKSLYTFCLCILVISAQAQYAHNPVFSGLSGETLQDALRQSYRPATLLEYGVARDTLFGRIDIVNDTLECVYSGMKLRIPPGADPTESIYLGGMANGMNTEHVYPQSKGASGFAQSDMHNLYATRIRVNSDRGDFPMGNIPDNIVKTWYLNTTQQSNQPLVDKDLWSELINGRFEPREAKKGDIARSIFYFYTMYRSEADAADPNFFNGMMQDLCDWHYLDPVDSTEWVRNIKIAKYQNTLNPFILDCSLVSRAYCNNIDQACESIIPSSTTQTVSSAYMSVFPNPTLGNATATVHITQSGPYTIRIISPLNRELYVHNQSWSVGTYEVVLPMDLVETGMYFVVMTNQSGKMVASHKLIKM